MGRSQFFIRPWIRKRTSPDAIFVDSAYGVSQCAAPAGSAAELDSEFAQQRLAFKIAPALRDLIFQDLLHGEMLHERNDVRKRFMKREDIGIRRLIEAPVHSIEDGMRRFVS